MTTTTPPPVIFLMGPTATGKTALACRLREALPVELISVDAAQVYRGMDAGTAKPGPEELARAPHRLIDIRDPAEPYSAADFCRDARREIRDIHRAGHIPLLVGGTMFYFHALEFGLSSLPAADPELRRELEAEAEAVGWPALHARLQAVDPVAAARIQPRDRQRIQRMLEVHRLTGRPASEIMSDSARPPLEWPVIRIGLLPADRGPLHDRIARRFQAMLDRGLVEETEKLLKRGDMGPHLPSIRMVGYRQVWQYLRDSLDYNEMQRQAIVATRRLAKRQITWLRGYPGVRYFDPWQPDHEQACLAYLQHRLVELGV